MAAVTNANDRAGTFLGVGPLVDVHLAVIVSTGNQVKRINFRFVRAVAMVYVGTVLARLPDAKGTPCERARLSCPRFVPERVDSALIL